MSGAASITVDAAKLVKALNTRRLSFQSELDHQWSTKALLFIGRIQRNWYSGRHQNDTGLYVQEGHLKGSWDKRIDKNPGTGDVVCTMLNDAGFARKHEFGHPEGRQLPSGAEKKSRQPKDATYPDNFPLPQRTFVRADFVKFGRDMFINGVRNALRKF
jgi:hypothetical protein